MRIRFPLDGLTLTISMSAVGIGLLLYLASFFHCGWNTSLFGLGWDTGAHLLVLAGAFIVLTSIPTMIRDRRFFLQHWGFGLTRLRQQFPLQFFPARRDKWLNTLAWCMTAAVGAHLAWLPAIGTGPNAESAVLRYTSVMLTSAGIMNVLSWDYPPTLKPQNSVRKR